MCKLSALRECYGKLFDSIKESDFASEFCAPLVQTKLISFTAMKGHQYDDAKDISGKPFRFMLVGRAVNGWDEYRINPELALTRENFVDASIANLTNAPEAMVLDGKDRFEWVVTEQNIAHNVYRPGIDSHTIDGKYFLKKSPLWNYSKGIWDLLSGYATRWGDRWFDRIVWSNLYKVGPHFEGNPGNKLQRAQIEACRELLEAEIDYFKPTHIFFATGRDRWFELFANLFECATAIGTNICFGEKKNSEFVEMIAKYRFADGETACVVVACRPERRDREKYVEQAGSYFKKVQDMTWE